jgi:hypothetical protein
MGSATDGAISSWRLGYRITRIDLQRAWHEEQEQQRQE